MINNQSQKYQQSSKTINLRKEFRVGNCNFSLQACRWKVTNFRQKINANENQLFGSGLNILKKPTTNSLYNVLSTPNLRLGQTAVILSDHIYMFGGVLESMEKLTFCALNLKNHKWHSLYLPSNPINRDSHGIAILQQEIYVFGGSNKSQYFNDIYSFNTFTNEWKSLDNKQSKFMHQNPSPRDPMIFINYKNQALLLIGGINFHSNEVSNHYLQDAYFYKNNHWYPFTKIINYPTNLIKSKAIQINNRVFMFGGFNHLTNQYNSKLYQIFISENQSQRQMIFKQVNLSIDIFPTGRSQHQLLKINNQYFILIGGRIIKNKQNKILKDIWIFDLFSVRWIRIQPKNGPLRGIHNFSAVMYNNLVYLVGGFVENKNDLNDQILMIQFANQEIFKSQVCENCINIVQKKQSQLKKFPKDLGISVGFLYNMALQIKFPFHAISMLYEASKYFHASYFRFFIEKTVNNFNFIRIQYDGCTFGRSQFLSFLSHRGMSPQLKKVTQSIKIASLRLGKTFLFVTSDKRFRYVYLLSAQSRVSPHFDESYVYYSYIQNIQLQRIQTQQGVKQRQLILNIIKTYISKPQVLLSTPQKSILLIFENKVVMSSQRDYICELDSNQHDIKIWKHDKKVQFLQQRGYYIQQDTEISLYKFMTLYYFKLPSVLTVPQFYINQSEKPIQFFQYKQILDLYQQKQIIHKVQLPLLTQFGIQLSGQIYITNHPHFVQNNYGLLMYSQGILYQRYDISFGKLFSQHFYKTKYKQARTIFFELGYINIEKGLQQNYFKNSFNKLQKYSILLQKINQKCDQKRHQIMITTNKDQNEISIEQVEGDNHPTKKVKI